MDCAVDVCHVDELFFLPHCKLAVAVPPYSAAVRQKAYRCQARIILREVGAKQPVSSVDGLVFGTLLE